MISLTLWYSREQAEGDIARTPAELDAAMDRIGALSQPGWPALAEVTQTDNLMGDMLYLGLHVDQGAIAWAGDTLREYTLGKGSTDGEPLLYMYMMSDCEFPPNSEVSAKLIRQAVHEFAETGQRPTCVEWQTWDRVLEDPTVDWTK